MWTYINDLEAQLSTTIQGLEADDSSMRNIWMRLMKSLEDDIKKCQQYGVTYIGDPVMSGIIENKCWSTYRYTVVTDEYHKRMDLELELAILSRIHAECIPIKDRWWITLDDDVQEPFLQVVFPDIDECMQFFTFGDFAMAVDFIRDHGGFVSFVPQFGLPPWPIPDSRLPLIFRLAEMFNERDM